MIRGIIGLLLLSGCTVVVEDRRLTREEIVTAFGQRDDAIKTLADAMNALIAKEKSKAEKK